MILANLSVPLAGILSVFGRLLALSPGKPQPFCDENGKPVGDSISEKVFVNLNGVEQGMFIKGKNVDNPILLYLHGGMPETFLTRWRVLPWLQPH
ncbi:MAG: hypothetical protein JW862_02215 [Anaerolineales bacterium]|nr:hypothetical protein [Anaerolineales bacterium]